MAWGVDEEARADVVGTASARLLAAGVPRADRTGAMRLLGVLSASADADGLVRRPLDDLAAEFELPADRVDDWLDALVDVDIVQRGPGALRLAGVEPPAAGGIRLADFLATAAAMSDRVEPTPLAPRRHRVVRPVPALAAAAAVAALLALVPALDRGSPDTTPVAAERPPAVQPAPTSTTAGATSTTTTGAEAEVTLPVVVPTTTTTVATTCPLGEPLLEVIGIAEGTAGDLTSVEGTATNPSAADLVLEAFTVVVEAGGQAVEVAGLDRPLLVPAGETVRWAVTTPSAALPAAVARVQLEGWHWSDPAVDRACG